jgi:adenosylcobinamide-GDP ribazoletransferase
LIYALRFLTILPLGRRVADPDRIGASQPYFPVVGLLIGALALSLDAGLRAFMPPLPAAAFLLLALTLVTGGLHLDGLMDTCDGVFHPSDAKRRLEILRDPRTGAFGAIGLGLDLLLQLTLFAAMPPTRRATGLVLALALAYWAMALAIFTFPAARPDGLGATFKRAATLPRFLLAAGAIVLICAGLGGPAGVLVLVLDTASVLIIGAYLTSRIGGLTGDTYGALHEAGLVAALLAWPLVSGGF